MAWTAEITNRERDAGQGIVITTFRLTGPDGKTADVPFVHPAPTMAILADEAQRLCELREAMDVALKAIVPGPVALPRDTLTAQEKDAITAKQAAFVAQMAFNSKARDFSTLQSLVDAKVIPADDAKYLASKADVAAAHEGAGA